MWMDSTGCVPALGQSPFSSGTREEAVKGIPARKICEVYGRGGKSSKFF